jgi:large subunit ribosomal protein L10
MALTKQQKQVRVDELHGELEKANTVIAASFERLTVAQDFELRKQIRSSGARYRVIKNTLAERAAKGTPAESVLKDLTGVTSIAYTSGDAVALARALQKYSKDNPGFTFKALVVEGRPMPAKDLAVLAALPSKEEIYAKLLFLIQAPAQRLATALAAVGRNTVVVINEAVKANKFAS